MICFILNFLVFFLIFCSSIMRYNKLKFLFKNKKSPILLQFLTIILIRKMIWNPNQDHKKVICNQILIMIGKLVKKWLAIRSKVFGQSRSDFFFRLDCQYSDYIILYTYLTVTYFFKISKISLSYIWKKYNVFHKNLNLFYENQF